MTAITLANPMAYLSDASVGDAAGSMIEDAKSNCGPILRGIDWILDQIIGWSPIEAILGPVAGDFNSVARMKENWASIGKALGHVGDNYTTMAGAVPDVWVERAATLAQRKMTKFSGAHLKQGEAADLMSRQLGNMLEATSKVIDAVAGILGLLEELVISWTAAKIAKELLTMGAGVRRAISLVNQAIKLIESLGKLIPALLEACGILATVLSAVNVILNFAAANRHTEAGGHVDNTADAGFK